MRLIWANEVKQRLNTSRSKYLANAKVKKAVTDLVDKCKSIEARPLHHKEGGGKMTNREANKLKADRNKTGDGKRTCKGGHER